MGHLLSKFARVSSETTCPKCGRDHYCLIRHDGRACICTLVESGGKHYKTRDGDTIGWLHYLPDGATVKPQRVEKQREYKTTREVAEYLASITRDRGAIARHARKLGLSSTSLMQMQAYEPRHDSLAFPMFDERNRPVGVRFRRDDGRKWSFKGGREGVFLSTAFDPAKPVFVAEGPTDSAALCAIGLTNVIGRPNCTGGGAIIDRLLGKLTTTPLVIVSDPKPQELDGAIKLADRLLQPCLVVVGPTDIREFVSSSELPITARRAILDSVGGHKSPWRVAFVNGQGTFYPFGKRFGVSDHARSTLGPQCSTDHGKRHDGIRPAA